MRCRCRRGSGGLLPGPQQEVLERAYYDGLTRQDIATQREQPPQTIQIWLRRGL